MLGGCPGAVQAVRRDGGPHQRTSESDEHLLPDHQCIPLTTTGAVSRSTLREVPVWGLALLTRVELWVPMSFSTW